MSGVVSDDDETSGSASVLSGMSSSVSSSMARGGGGGTIVRGRKKRLSGGGGGGGGKEAQARDKSRPTASADGGRTVPTVGGGAVVVGGGKGSLSSSSKPKPSTDGDRDDDDDDDARGRRRRQRPSSSSSAGGILAAAGRSLRSLSRSRGGGSRARGGESDRSSGEGGGGGGGGMEGGRNNAGMYSGGRRGDDAPPSSSSNGGGTIAIDAVDLIVTVTSCRSDAYHDQRAPGATSKLPRRAPSALKTFHELAVGIKDAYEAGGCVILRPPPRGDYGGGGVGGVGGVPSSIGVGSGDGGDDDGDDNDGSNVVTNTMSDAEWERRATLFEFMGNLDFLLALVDEVAIDTATRGALKEDTTFRGLRDVIKKCNKVLELMLVRRERKYTLMFRIVGSDDVKILRKITKWNTKVEKALGGVTQDYGEDGSSAASSWRRKVEGGGDESSEAGSELSSVSTSSTLSSSVGAVLRRGREMLPSAGKVRARRATPTPRLRRRRDGGGGDSAGEDGYSSDIVPMTTENLARLQLSLDTGIGGGGGSGFSPPSISELHGDKRKRGDGASLGIAEPSGLGQVKPMKPKDELLDVIRGLRAEQMRAREAIGSSEIGDSRNSGNVLDEIKSNFTPKAEIPSAVPKLPIEYIHRHRLMKQVVNCLLDRATGPRDTDDVDKPFANNITCITSRHSDKAGNGKTTLAVAAIQTVEVREFFSDGIAWIHLGRTALGEREVRRMYEQLYVQLLGNEEGEGEDHFIEGKDDDGDEDNVSNSSSDSSDDENKNIIANGGKGPNGKAVSNVTNSFSDNKLTVSRRYFQGGELEGMKEDLSRLLISRRVLICLDDVYKMDDAKWFLFGMQSDGKNKFEDTPHRVLITTRIPGLVGPGITHEVFVRIFSEHEAVKLLLTAAGRRPNGLPKVSPVFAQARIIVKGCGNSPLALRIAGGMLRSRNRNWTLSSPAWKLLVEQCRTSLEEASRIRSFANSVQRLIDLSFATVTDTDFRNVLRECFVAFAMVFHDTDSLKVGKGISRVVVIRFFAVVASMEGGRLPSSKVNDEEWAEYMDYATLILDTLETMNLVQRAGHGLSKSSSMSRLDTKDIDATNTIHSNHKCYSMHESVSVNMNDVCKP
ncbi:hypothetical protein ACHAXA_005725 [Cyclostephanos tholiformis]|uniref:NB-ARC domain-containing protein n=1 Tax=Cyclostephanos tholiformis TaxID=382380 RepID=A0ABD3R5U2_9STRA